MAAYYGAGYGIHGGQLSTGVGGCRLASEGLSQPATGLASDVESLPRRLYRKAFAVISSA